MKLQPATQTWLIFSSIAAIIIFACGLLRAMGIVGQGSLFAAFAVSIVLLLYLAIKLANGRSRLNLTHAAETLVALGIFSLITSISVVLFSVTDLMTEIGSRDLSIEDMRRFAWPFGEGLAAAAIAPFIATLLRHIEANLSTVESGETGIPDAGREAAALADELKLSTVNLKNINAELDKVPDALERAFGGTIKATNTLSVAMQTEAERLRVGLQRVQAEATALAEATEKSRMSVTDLRDGLSGLSSSSKDARELLDALGKLIESVERYIKPD